MYTTTDCMLYFVQTQWSSHAASICVYNMAVCNLSAQSASSTRPSLSFQLPGKEKSPSLAVLPWFIPASVFFFSLCGNWRLSARHRPTNILFPRPASSTQAFHLLLRLALCLIQFRECRFLDLLAKHLKIASSFFFFFLFSFSWRIPHCVGSVVILLKSEAWISC